MQKPQEELRSFQNIPYILRRKRFSRVLRFAVHADGKLVVTAPVLLPKRMIEQTIAQKADWILAKISFAKKHAKPVAPKRTAKEVAEDKRNALRLVNERLEYFNQIYGFSWNRIAIRNQRTRWGSCSGKGNLNFNYKIALLPSHLSDYIIVHELCHLGQMNHSAKFWNLVARTIPDYVKRRRAIRSHDIQLQ
ncbi:MAG: M48 family metallopeptidase [Patescibacteria group bacterium]|jgi:hypothetical protein